MESRPQHPSAPFAGSEDFARAAADADTAAELLLGLGDRGFWWTLTPVHPAPAPTSAPASAADRVPDFVPTVPLAELPDEAVEVLREWVTR